MESLTAYASYYNLTTLFVFSKRSTTNAEILVNGRPRYEISTTDSQLQHTRVIDAVTKTELVSIRRRAFRSDKITLVNHHDGAEKQVTDVVQKRKTEDG